MNRNENKYFRTAEKMNVAFLEILEKKDFAYITVKELCERAGVHRSTFYLHYETLEDLLSETVEYMNRQFRDYMRQRGVELAGSIGEHPLEELYFITPEYLRPYLCYVKENRRLLYVAIRNSKVLRLEESYDRMFRSIFVPILARYRVPEADREYLMSFYIHGLSAIITQWLKDECKDPVEHVMQIICDCIRYDAKTSR